MFNGVISEFADWSAGQLDVLYNNAGIGRSGYFEAPDVITQILQHIRAREAAELSPPRAPPPRIKLPATRDQYRLF